MGVTVADRVRREVEPLGTLVVTLLPLVGVLFAGWSTRTVVALYWVELGAVGLFAAVGALFATPHTNDPRLRGGSHTLEGKRGTVSLGHGLPPIHVRNVPFTFGVVLVLGAVWAAVAAVFGLSLATLDPAGLALLVGGGALTVVARGAAFRETFLDERAYEEHSLGTLVRPPPYQVTVLVAGAFLLAFAVPETLGVAVVAAIVVVRLFLDHRARNAKPRAERDRPPLLDVVAHGPRGRDTYGDPLDPVVLPDRPADATVRPDRRALALRSILATSPHRAPGTAAVVLGVVACAGLAVAISLGPVATLAALALVGGCWGLFTAERYLVHAPLEYRRYGDTLVAYDRWLDEPQWRVHLTDGTEFEATERAVSRLTGAETVELRWVADGAGDAGRERLARIGPFRDDAAETLGLPARHIGPSTPNVRLGLLSAVGAGVVLAGAVLAVSFVGAWTAVVVLPFGFLAFGRLVGTAVAHL